MIPEELLNKKLRELDNEVKLDIQKELENVRRRLKILTTGVCKTRALSP